MHTYLAPAGAQHPQEAEEGGQAFLFTIAIAITLTISVTITSY